MVNVIIMNFNNMTAYLYQSSQTVIDLGSKDGVSKVTVYNWIKSKSSHKNDV